MFSVLSQYVFSSHRMCPQWSLSSPVRSSAVGGGRETPGQHELQDADMFTHRDRERAKYSTNSVSLYQLVPRVQTSG